MKKLRAMLFILFIITLSFVLNYIPAYATNLADGINDINSHWANPFMENLQSNDIVEINEFQLHEYDTPITRGRFVDLLVRVLINESNNDNFNSINFYFSDVPDNNIFHSPIIQACLYGIIKGYPDGTFRPGDFIERQDIFTIIGRSYDAKLIYNDTKPIHLINTSGFADGMLIAEYAVEYINLLKSISLIVGYEDNTIRPNDSITHAEVFALVERIYMLNKTALLNDDTIVLSETLPDEISKNGITVDEGADNQIIADKNQASNENASIGNNNINNSGGNGSGGGGGSGNNYSGGYNQNNYASYDFGDSAGADIDSLFSFKNIRSVKFVSTYSNKDSITLSSYNEIKGAIDILRDLELYKPDPLYNYETGGGVTTQMTFYYADGSFRIINYIRIGIYIDNLFYPLLNLNEGILAENQFVNMLSQINATITNNMYPDESDNYSNFNLSNSHKIWQLFSYQKPQYSKEFKLLNEQSAIMLNTLNATDNYVFNIYDSYKIYQTSKENIAFGETIDYNDYYWLASAASANNNAVKSVGFKKNTTGDWHYILNNESEEHLVQIYQNINNLLKASYEITVSQNVSTSPMGMFFDNLNQNIEDARIIEINEYGMCIIYIKTNIDEYGYILSLNDDNIDLEMNTVYQIKDIIAKIS